MWTYNQSSELYHHGIKGQKWGIRRYQNEDGSLTEAGKKRYITTQKKLINKLNRSIDKVHYYKERNKMIEKSNKNIMDIVGQSYSVNFSKKFNDKKIKKYTEIGSNIFDSIDKKYLKSEMKIKSSWHITPGSLDNLTGYYENFSFKYPNKKKGGITWISQF